MESCPYCSSPVSDHAKFCPTCGGKLQQSQHLPVGAVLGGKYRIEKVLGQGGFGITYQATHVNLEQPVAVKEYFPEGAVRQGTSVVTNLSGGNEFLAEGQRLATLQHPGIVRVQDILSENNTFYLVNEFVAGKSLKQLLEDRGPLKEAEALGYIERAAEALELVHQAGMLHQDIKPDNLMLSADGRVVLIDFSASRHFLRDKTGNDTRVVTPGYEPIEQYGQQVKRGPYTDIYALGATLYTLLTGETPPAAPDRVHDPSLPKLTCSKAVRKALERAMAVSYLKRPQSVQEFLQLLRGKSINTTRPAPNPKPQPQPSPIPQQGPIKDITLDLANGGTFQLGKGRYQVKGLGVVRGDLQITGEGSDTVIEVMVVGGGAGLHCPEGRKLGLKGVRLVVSGQAKSALWIEGQYDLESIHLAGDSKQEVGIRFSRSAAGTLTNSFVSNMQCGALLEGNSSGRFFKNSFTANIYHGICVLEQANVTLEGNTCKGNQSCGIAYEGESTGLAKGNSCEGNGGHGIQVRDKAALTLEGNTCKGNQQCGISYTGESKGLVRGNTCEGNTGHGIQVGDKAALTLEGNTCNVNQRCGIVYFGKAKGLAKGNTCEGNTYDGIQIGNKAAPTLEGNTCKGNHQDGIFFTDGSKGLAKSNTCKGNTLSGIGLAGHAAPTLEGNTCNANQQSGIFYDSEAKGLAKGNVCEGNTKNGIYVGLKAAPTLKSNTCKDSQWSGIAYGGESNGLAKGNTCEGNVLNGIAVWDSAAPTLESNTCQNNGRCGILIMGNAKATAVRNVCTGHPEFDIVILDPAKATLKDNTGKAKEMRRF